MNLLTKLKAKVYEPDITIGIMVGLLLMAIDSVLFLFLHFSDLLFFISLSIAFLIGISIGIIISIKYNFGKRISKIILYAVHIDYRFVPAICTFIIAFVCLAFWVTDYLPLNTWGMDYHELAWHSNKPYIILSAIFIIATLYLINHKSEWTLHDCKTRKSCIWIIYYLLISFLVTVSIWQPGTNVGYSIYHRHAYIYEIYSRYYLVPYSSKSSGVYGHFGLFFMPFLKISGKCTITSITVIIYIIAIITSMLFSLAVHNVSQCRIVRLTAPIAISLPFLWSTKAQLYYQGNPHRLFLTAIFCYLLSKAVTFKGKKKYYVMRHIAASFALLWSSDMGIAFFAAVFIWDAVEAITIRKKARYIFLAFCNAAIELAVALLCVNLYNILTGGKLILSDFFFPYTTSYVSSLDASLISNNNAFYSLAFWYPYFWILAIYIAIAFLCFFHSLTDCREDINPIITDNILTTASFYGVCCMVYYINRPAYGNLLQTIPILIFCLCVLIERAIHSTKDKFTSNLFGKSLLQSFLVVFATASLISLPHLTVTYIKNQSQSDIFIPAAEALGKSVPENTYCVGVGAFETCSLLHWDNISLRDEIHLSFNSASQAETYHYIYESDSFVLFDYAVGSSLTDCIGGLTELIQTDFNEVTSYSSPDNMLIWKYYVRK